MNIIFKIEIVKRIDIYGFNKEEEYFKIYVYDSYLIKKLA